ncbi:MAG: DNA polymerase III subunit delta [Ruminococcaceae bacterium]|nr:DNA polymerase III subunit delta [Oscillospiraceae bacterium]
MNIITEADYRKLIGKTAGRAFLFFGEEDYLKSYDIKATRERVCPDSAFAVFNDITLDAMDFTADKLLDAMTPPPMMADERLIVLRGLDFTSIKAAELDALTEALALLSEYDYNTVIIHVAAGLIDEGYLPKRPGTVLKKLSEVTTPVQFAASTGARLAAWAGKHFQHLGVTVSPADCNFLIAFAGKSMYLLASEIEKVAYYVLANGRSTATEADIRLCAVAATDMDAFALSNAILAGRTNDALDALAVMKFERTEPTLIMAELSKTLCDMQATRLYLDAGKNAKEIAAQLKCHEYKAGLLVKAVSRISHARLTRAVRLCAEGDAALKRSASDYTAIEKLICSL